MKLNSKILKDNINRHIFFKKKGEIDFRHGIICEVSGRTKEFNDGSDWHQYNLIIEFSIITNVKNNLYTK